jgi:glycosyltransferase involved in cell wall biosynthesis
MLSTESPTGFPPPLSISLAPLLTLRSRVKVIPHGVPTFPPKLLSQRSFSSSSAPVLISNGLIHQGKGLEYAIEAIPALLSAHPTLKYFILGTPHPTGTGTRDYYRSSILPLLSSSQLPFCLFCCFSALFSSVQVSSTESGGTQSLRKRVLQ